MTRRVSLLISALAVASLVAPAGSRGQSLGGWLFSNPFPQGNAINGVAAGGGLLVAVGGSGAVLTSADNGVSWTTPSFGTADWLWDACWGAGRFVAVGDGGTVLTSTDGTTWDPASFPSNLSPDEVAFGGGTFLAANGHGQIFISASGTSWSQVGDFNTYGIDGFAWNGAVWVAVGGDPGIQVSSNGYGWSPAATAAKNLFDVVWTGTRFVATGGSRTLTSPDGSAWTEHAAGVTGLGKLAWNGSVLVAVGSRAYATAGQIATSPDGISWTLRSSGVSEKLFAVAWSGTTFVAVGDNGAILTSPDGVAWTRRDGRIFAATPLLREAAWTGSAYVAVGADGAILTGDPSGTSWLQRTSGTGVSIGGVVWTGTRLVAAGAAGTILTSPDGAAWAAVAAPTSENLNNIHAGGPLLVAVGWNGTILTSPDGSQWTQRASGTSKHLQDVVWNGTRYLLVGSGGTVLASPDGVTWTPQAFTFANDLSGVAWNGSRFVAVGSGGMLWSSTDGAAWSSHDAGLTGSYSDVAWIGAEFVAVGQYGNTAVSPDGLAWSARPAATRKQLYGVAWSGQRCVAVGESATILVATCGHTDLVVDSVAPTTGPAGGGTGVTVRGRGFAAGATVRFGGLQAGGVTVVDATTLTAVTPAHPVGAVDVTVSGGGGRTATLVNGFAFADVVPLSISLAPAELTVFAGGTGTLQVTVQPPPGGDLTIALSTSDGLVAAVPSSVTVAAQQSSAAFAVTGVRPGGPARITATLPAAAGGASAGSDVTVLYRAVVPAVAHAPGMEGSRWRSDVAVMNPGSAAAELLLTYVSGAAPVSRLAELAGGSTVEWGDLLVTVFGYSSSASTKGTLEVVSNVPVVVAARTYNQAAGGGTFGQFMPAVTEAMALTDGEVGVLPQLKRSEGFRTNVGAVNFGHAQASVRVRLWGPGGSPLGERTLTAGPLQTVQETDIFQTVGAGMQPVAYATVEPTTAGASVWAYGSVVDNLTNDPATVPLLEASQAATRCYVPAVAHAPGMEGSRWRSDVAVMNPGSAAATLSLTYVSATGSVARTEVLAGGATVEWGDLLVSVFGYAESASTKGTLEVASNVPVVVAARTYNQAASGTFGQFMPAVTEAMALTAGEVGYLPQLKRNDGFRTNVGVVNLGSVQASVRVRLWDASGAQVGERALTVGALQTVQETDIFASVGALTQPVACATVEPTTAGASVWAYGSVVDNLTNDPTTVPLVAGGHAAP